VAELKKIVVPDIGDFKDVSVIEVMVKVGETIEAEQNLLTLETDKAAMEVPSPYAGVVKEMMVRVGDRVSQGTAILLLESAGAGATQPSAKAPDTAPSPPKDASMPSPPVNTKSVAPAPVTSPEAGQPLGAAAKAHASPAIRRLARELGVQIGQVRGSGAKGRVTKEDIQSFVKTALGRQPAPAGPGGIQVPAMPVVDFAKFGAIETKPLSRIRKLSGANLHRNWVAIPHVTQFDEADITEMDAFRKELGEEYAKQGVRITPLAFILKAVVVALQNFPEFNASLDAGGENLVLKQYYHVGVAVDTPEGLVVPVVRDVDKKGIVQLAKELGEVSARAREKKISAAEMQGGSFSISSLGGIGGTAFTPIINAPELAILGVSKAIIKPMHQDDTFVARLMLPLSLSYDHRVIDGAAAARFVVYLSQVLADPRRLSL
jgi:pyruvate dehydrogenase E2 component (dihydrolipoamide acetyltransferase)